MTTTVYSDESNALIRLGDDDEIVEANTQSELFQIFEDGGDDVITGFNVANDLVDLRFIDLEEGELTSELTEDGFLFSWDGGSLLLEGVSEDVSHLAVVAEEGIDTDIIFAGPGTTTIVTSPNSNTVVVGFDVEEDILAVDVNSVDPEVGLSNITASVEQGGTNIQFGNSDTFLINAFDDSIANQIQVIDFYSLF